MSRRKPTKPPAAEPARTPTAPPGAPTPAGSPPVTLADRLVREAREFLTGVVPLLALVLVFRVAFAEPYHIPSGSMEPTLLVGDRLFVNKLRFGPHIPFTTLALPGYAEPGRGDVVVFESPPQDPAIRISPEEVSPTLVKRIAGMPGDTIMMRKGVFSVNGAPQPDPRPDGALPVEGTDAPLVLLQWQHAIEVRHTRFGEPPEHASLHDWGPLVVPAGHYFMLGDNRDVSVDSRFYGPVPRANLRGAPMFIFHSYDTERGLDFLRGITEVRWGRIGHWVK